MPRRSFLVLLLTSQSLVRSGYSPRMNPESPLHFLRRISSHRRGNSFILSHTWCVQVCKGDSWGCPRRDEHALPTSVRHGGTNEERGRSPTVVENEIVLFHNFQRTFFQKPIHPHAINASPSPPTSHTTHHTSNHYPLDQLPLPSTAASCSGHQSSNTTYSPRWPALLQWQPLRPSR